MEYDVFISCKNEDYHFARKIYNYLTAHNYNAFLSDTELRKKGNADYGEIIDDALDVAKHLVIVASNPQYVVSPYVKTEWRTFIEEKRTGRKTGNIVTVISFSIDLLPIGLRHFQSFDFNSYSSVVDYLPNDITIKKPNDEKKSIINTVNPVLNVKQIKYSDLNNDVLNTLSKAGDRNADVELGMRYFCGNKGKFKSENMAKYFLEKAGLTIEECLGLHKADKHISKLSNEALLELCKMGNMQACIEMGLRYYRGVKGKGKSLTMAKYYWNKLGISFKD